MRSKDQELYAILVRRYEDKLTRYASVLISVDEEASDIVQDAFIKAFRNLNGFNTKQKFSAWIYRIVHNEAINHVKKYRRFISLDANNWVEKWAHYSEKHDELFDQDQLRKAMKKCLDQLPVEYKEPLALYYYEEKSYEEIAEILRMPVPSVGTRIHRAKKLLQKKCTEEGLRI